MSSSGATATAGPSAREPSFTGRTAWVRNLKTPLRGFLRTETGSAGVLLAAAIASLVWANVDSASYGRVWQTTLSIRIGLTGVSHDLRYWLNSGLMTLFFFVVGLEARREFDLGELRERRRVSLPLAAGVGGMLVPVAIFLALNAQRDSAHGWGVAMSTDTAFALGMLALVGPRFPLRLRAFMLTVSVVDDVVALIVIATVYAAGLHTGALLSAAGVFAAIVLAVRLGIQRGFVYAPLGVAAWVALSKSGVDPIVIGLAMGLLTFAAPAARGDLERASDRHSDGLRRRQANRNRRGIVARDEAERWARAPARRVGRACRGRLDRRDRLHGFAADRGPRVPWRAARRGEARRVQRGAVRVDPHVARLPGDDSAARAPAHPRAGRNRGDDPRPRRARR